VLEQLRDALDVIRDYWQQLTPRTRQHIVIAATVVAAYIVTAPLFVALVFSAPSPSPSDAPRIGAMMVQRDIKSTFVFRRTSADTGGAYVELDLVMDAGGGPGNVGAHVHPDIEERLQVLEGTATVTVGRHELQVPAGSQVVIPKGMAHSIRNATDRFAVVRERFTPAKNLDYYYVQVDRAGGFAGAGRTRLAVLSTWYDQQYPATLPLWMTKLGTLLVAPTARLAGVRAYYPPA
jgi:mannose-6-phosphate isomerase-like protein (cupin superfamily)